MIRFAQKDDINKIIDLWNICFPDESGFNEWFFKNVFDFKNTLLYIKSNEICAMLQMLPYQLMINNTPCPITYIYGACTSPNFRKQGLMAKLLKYSFELDISLDKYASVLIPQEPWLFDFYKKFGYYTSFFLDNRVIKSDGKPKYAKIRLCNENDIDGLDEIYTKCNTSMVIRTNEHWKRQLSLFSEVGEGAYCLEENGEIKAYSFFWKVDDFLWAQEAMAVNDDYLNIMAQQIMYEKNIDALKITCNNGNERFGCAKIYKSDEINKQAYMNLLYN